MAEQDSRERPYAVIRDNPGFLRLWLGQAVSQTGDWFAGTAVLALALSLTGSGLAVAMVLASRMVPLVLFGPLAGMIADRVDRRRLAVTVDVIRAVVAVCFLAVRTPEQMPAIYLLMFLLSVGGVLHVPALRSMIPDVVPRDKLLAANAVFRSTFGVTQVLGSALGGTVAVLVGRDAAFLFNACSFLFAAGCVATLAVRHVSGDPKQKTEPGQLWAGFRLIASSSVLVTVFVVLFTGAIGQGSAQVLRVYFGHMVFGAQDLGIGLLNSGLGLGRIVGPLLFAHRLSSDPERLLTIVGPLCVLHGMAYVLFSFSPYLVLGVSAQILLGAVDFIKDTCLATIIMTVVPGHLRGRVFAAELVIIRSAHFAFQLLIGILLISVSPRLLMLGTGGLPLIVCGVVLLWLSRGRSRC